MNNKLGEGTSLRRGRLWQLIQQYGSFDVFSIWEIYLREYPDDIVPHQILWTELYALEELGLIWCDFAPGILTFRLGEKQ